MRNAQIPSRQCQYQSLLASYTIGDKCSANMKGCFHKSKESLTQCPTEPYLRDEMSDHEWEYHTTEGRACNNKTKSGTSFLEEPCRGLRFVSVVYHIVLGYLHS